MSEKQIIHCATYNLFIWNYYVLFQKYLMKPMAHIPQDKLAYLKGEEEKWDKEK